MHIHDQHFACTFHQCTLVLIELLLHIHMLLNQGFKPQKPWCFSSHDLFQENMTGKSSNKCAFLGS